MVTKGTSGVAKGLAVGVGILVGSLAGWGEGWAQMPGASRGMPAPSGSAQPQGQVTGPSLRSATPDQRHQSFDRDGDRDRHRDHDRHWGDQQRYYPPYRYYSGHHPNYGYYYYPPYGTYPGRWVWDGHNWLFVPIY
jgi:hypothetical protein